MERQILVMGGLGYLGFSIVLDLLENPENIVSVLENKSKIESSQTLIKPLLGKVNFLYLNGEKFLEFSENEFVNWQPKEFDVVIIAVRNRTPYSNYVNSYGLQEVDMLLEQFSSTVIAPLRVLQLLKLDQDSEKDRTIIQLISSNSNYISHQSMTYHVINSALESIFRFLSVNMQRKKIKVFLVEIGVILNSGSNKISQDKDNFIEDPKLIELSDLVQFLIKTPGYGLVGTLIKLTGIRNLLDTTAVAEGVFGNLQVRK